MKNESLTTTEVPGIRSAAPWRWDEFANELSGFFSELAVLPDLPTSTASLRNAMETLAERRGMDRDTVRSLLDAVVAILAQRRGDDPARQSTLGRSALRIDHVAIAVKNLDAAIAELREKFGFEVVERRDIKTGSSGMFSATVRSGDVTFVLCQGADTASNVSRYIEAYGQGVQHLAIEVLDEHSVVSDLRRRGADLLTDVIRGPGLLQTFTRRSAQTGMQFEFLARSDNHGFDDESVKELYSAMERADVF